MLVTLFSDASICPDTGCVGWAAWAKSDRGTARADGALRRPTIDSGVAEAMAVVNGIAIAARRGLMEKGDVIVVQTDNNGVMSVLRGEARRHIRRANRGNVEMSGEQLHDEILRRNEEIDEVAAKYASLVHGLGVTVVWKHCKGHRGLEDRRAAVNTSCDERARDRMREARRSMPIHARDALRIAA